MGKKKEAYIYYAEISPSSYALQLHPTHILSYFPDNTERLCCLVILYSFYAMLITVMSQSSSALSNGNKCSQQIMAMSELWDSGTLLISQFQGYNSFYPDPVLRANHTSCLHFSMQQFPQMESQGKTEGDLVPNLNGWGVSWQVHVMQSRYSQYN